MKRIRKGMILLSILSLLLCTRAHADTLSDWTARYDAAAAAAGLSPTAYTQDFGDGAYGISLDDGFILAMTVSGSAIDSVVITGISSQDRLALVCGAALYACDSELTIEAAIAKIADVAENMALTEAAAEMDPSLREYDSLSRFCMLANGWVYMMEDDGTDTIVCLTRAELLGSYVAESWASSALPETEQPSEGEATPAEASILPEATQSPVRHTI